MIYFVNKVSFEREIWQKQALIVVVYFILSDNICQFLANFVGIKSVVSWGFKFWRLRILLGFRGFIF
ncbi:hypothetical protein JCM14076_27090 [Methylosoma difficile]